MWVLDEEPVDVDSVAHAGGLPGGSTELTNMVVMWCVFSLCARDRSDNYLLHQQGVLEPEPEASERETGDGKPGIKQAARTLEDYENRRLRVFYSTKDRALGLRKRCRTRNVMINATNEREMRTVHKATMLRMGREPAHAPHYSEWDRHLKV